MLIIGSKHTFVFFYFTTSVVRLLSLAGQGEHLGLLLCNKGYPPYTPILSVNMGVTRGPYTYIYTNPSDIGIKRCQI